ncbi:MAG: hypothetical protein Q8S73_15870 [Deltaproteobacteria bacterium]|nr:hypothetical protein [Myxococcales bacterium]MDP3215585.1 hypothetical protein [Deltaproteobacteria bacterium]
MTAPTQGSAAVRAHLLNALAADLLGPFNGDPNAAEVLSRPPSRFYLTGFLAPSGDRDPGNPTDDDEFCAGNDPDDEQSSPPPSRASPPLPSVASVRSWGGSIPRTGASDPALAAMITWTDVARDGSLFRSVLDPAVRGTAEECCLAVPLMAITDTEARVNRVLAPLVASGGPW